MNIHVTAKSLQWSPILCDPMDPLSMEFSRQECWSGLPCPPPGDLPDPGIEPTSHVSCIGRQVLDHEYHLEAPFLKVLRFICVNLLTRWTWVWVDSGSWWWTGRPGVLLFMGSQRVGHNWVTELNWTELKLSFLFCKYPRVGIYGMCMLTFIKNYQTLSEWCTIYTPISNVWVILYTLTSIW